jgi:Fe-S cluster assembly protein SufD
VTTKTTTGFDEEALAALPHSAPFVEALRKEAFASYLALPVPSSETEEWRYTDVSGLDLDLRPFAGGGAPEAINRHSILAAAGSGERAGLQVQRNSEVISTQFADGLAERGVWFGDLDGAIAERPELVEPYLHSLVHAERSKFTALHAAFRTGGTLVYVPRDVRIELPLQTLTWIDAEGTAVFPHTLIVAEQGAELTFIDRYSSPALGGALSDAGVEIFAGPIARGALRGPAGVRPGRGPSVRAAGTAGSRRIGALARRGLRREPGARRG